MYFTIDRSQLQQLYVGLNTMSSSSSISSISSASAMPPPPQTSQTEISEPSTPPPVARDAGVVVRQMCLQQDLFSDLRGRKSSSSTLATYAQWREHLLNSAASREALTTSVISFYCYK